MATFPIWTIMSILEEVIVYFSLFDLRIELCLDCSEIK